MQPFQSPHLCEVISTFTGSNFSYTPCKTAFNFFFLGHILQKVRHDWMNELNWWQTTGNIISSVQLLSHVRLFMTPWTTCSMSGVTAHHHLQELAQTHVRWVSDAIQPSHPLSSPFPPSFNLSQHQDLSKWVSSSHQVAKVLEFQLQHQSFCKYSGLISCMLD